MEREEKQFVSGMLAYKPFDTAPNFVKGNLVVFRDDMIEWLKTQPEHVSLDLKESKAGKYYLQAQENKAIGISANKPVESAPDFVKSSLDISRDKMITWLQTQPERVNLDLKESTAGKHYIEVSTYKKQSIADQTIARENRQVGAPREKLPDIAYPETTLDEFLEDMPF